MKTSAHALLGILLIAFALPASAVLPIQNEEIIVTCFSGTYNYYTPGSSSPIPTGFVVAKFDTNSGNITSLIPPANSPPVVWTGAASGGYHNEGNPGNEWQASRLGELFGIAIDDQASPDIYVGASDVYNLLGSTTSHNATAPQGPGGLYKLSGTNGAVIASTSLPSVGGSVPGTGPGLGNLCFRRADDSTPYLYVSNLDDGKIYRVNANTLATVNSFDHGFSGRPNESLSIINDLGTPGMTQYGRRIWGVKTYQNRLYYAVWSEDSRNVSSAVSNEVWSVDLDAAGNFLPLTAARRLTLPNYPDIAGGLWSNPIASIDFSPSGAMYLAERYWQLKPLGAFDLTFGSHFSRLHRFTLSGPNWVTTPATTHKVGGAVFAPSPPYGIVGASSAGGVAVNCDDSIWATGDMYNGYLATDSTTNLPIPGAYYYGALRIQPGGNDTPLTPYGHGGFIVDYDGTYGLTKFALGAIVTRRECCMTLASANVQCPLTPGGPYTADVTITNLTNNPVTDLQFGPCPNNQLPPGTITLTPSPANITLGSPLAPNASTTVNLSFPNIPPTGTAVCFLVQFFDPGSGSGEPHVTCTGKICITLPKCPCAELTASNIQCPPCVGDPYTLDLAIQNIWNTPYYWYELVPCPPSQIPPGANGATPAPAGIQPFNPAPLNPNQTQTIPVSLPGIPDTGGLWCFCLRLYDQQENVLLCEEMICVTLPPCTPGPGMTIQQVGQILCPPYPGGPFKITFNVTNTQPLPAYGVVIAPCSDSGSPGGPFFGATPGNVTFAPPLAQGQTSQNITVCLTGLNPGDMACLCVRFLDQNGRPFCLEKICFTLPPCDDPPPCLDLVPQNILCPTGSSGYSFNLNLTNNSGSDAYWYEFCPVPNIDLPLGAVTGQPLPAGLQAFNPSPVPGTGGIINLPGIQLPLNVPDGATFCFLVKLYGEFENELICEELICIPLPRCACATVTGDVTCVEPYPNRQVVFSVTNNTNVVGTPFNFASAVVIPTLGFTPSVMTPVPNPIVPGASGIFTTTFNGFQAPTCVMLLIFNEDKTKCCRVKVCPLWVECDPGPPKDTCDLASETVTEASGLAPQSAWITNNSPTLPKIYSWSISPIAIAGCTGTLVPANFTPSSGTTGLIGPGSSTSVNFTVNAAALAPGQCAGYQICFTALDPINIVQPVCCPTVIRRNSPSDPCVILNPTGRKIPALAGPVDIIIKNPTGVAMDLDVILFDTGGNSSYAAYPPPWPSNPDDICARIIIPPGESAPMLMSANLAVGTGGGGGLPPVYIDPKLVELIWLRTCNNAQGYEILGTQIRFQPGGSAPHVFGQFDPMLPVTGVSLGTAFGTPVFQLDTYSDPGGEYHAYSSTDLQNLAPGGHRVWPTQGYRLMTTPDGTFLGKDGTMSLQLPVTPGVPREFYRVRAVPPVFGSP